MKDLVAKLKKNKWFVALAIGVAAAVDQLTGGNISAVVVGLFSSGVIQ